MESGIANIGFLLERTLINMRESLVEALNNAGINLTFSEYEVMRVLFKSGNQSQSQIASFLHKDRATVKRTIDLLRDKDYVEKGIFNGRQNEISVTAKGLAEKDYIIRIADCRISELFQDFSEDQISEFVNILVQLSGHSGTSRM